MNEADNLAGNESFQVFLAEVMEKVAEMVEGDRELARSAAQAVVEEFMTKTLGLSQAEMPLEVWAFRRSLTEETDRGCALAASAHLDDAIKNLLQASLVDDAKLFGRLCGPQGSIGSFSSRIDLAFAMGLIPALIWRDLHRIRGVRNEFAHKSGPVNFTDPKIKTKCDALEGDFFQSKLPPRAKFTRAVMGVLGVLDFGTKRSQRPSIPRDPGVKRPAARKVAADLERKIRQAVLGARTSGVPK